MANFFRIIFGLKYISIWYKYDGSGNEVWASAYAYGNLIDIPTAIELIGAELVVAGFSGSSITNNDNVTLKYDINSGSQTDVQRTTNTNIGAQDMLSSMAADSIGNVYTVGTVLGNNGDYNMQIQKLDTALAVLWTQNFDGFGFDDAGINLDLDDSLNVYVTGYTYRSSSDKQLAVIKYNSSGSLVWAKLPNKTLSNNSEGLRVKVKTGNEIFIGGNISKNSNQDLCLLRMNRTGNVTMQKTYNGQANGTDKFMDLTFDNNNHIFVSARSATAATSTTDHNIIVEYVYKDFVLSPTTSSVSGDKYAANELIISFLKPVLKMNKINDREFLFGKLSDFVEDSTCNKITSLLDLDGRLKFNAKEVYARKIFLNMTEADSISDSRMGDYVAIPPFYTKLLITLPSNLDVESAAANISGINSDLLGSQLNFIYEPFWTPNDSLYPNQSNLHPTTAYPNAHINMEKAWDYTKGHQYIRVGVYDTGINKQHVDLTPSVVRESCYFNQVTPAYEDLAGHGTYVAGLIGARSNNAIGIAGIAGGNGIPTTAGSLNTGVSLANMQVFNQSLFATTAFLIQAYKQGADGLTVVDGAALNVTNHSYGQINNAVDDALIEGINYQNLNGVAFIAARGNALAGAQNFPLTQYSAPACLRPGMVMNVGASGTDGHYHKKNVNGATFSSMINHNVDFIAPGDTANVRSTAPSYPLVIPWKTTTNVLNGSYDPFSGTSAAAPHVTGVVALMMSYRNNPVASWDNLVHEDCEAILKRTATDLVSATYAETIGQDSTSGYGRINADSALSAVQFQYKIRHIDKTHYSTGVSTSTTMVASNVVRFFTGFPVGSPLNPGTYNVNIVEVQTTYSYPFGSETYLDSWPLYKASNGYPSSFPAIPNIPYPIISTNVPNYSEIVSVGLTSATVKSYVYYFISTAAVVPQPRNIWAPASPANLKTAFTLYTLGDATLNIKNNEAQVDYFNVYPNPSSGHFTVGFNSKTNTKAILIVSDIMGRTVYANPSLNIKFGLNRPELSLNHLPKGIYFLSLDIENNKAMVKKILIE